MFIVRLVGTRIERVQRTSSSIRSRILPLVLASHQLVRLAVFRTAARTPDQPTLVVDGGRRLAGVMKPRDSPQDLTALGTDDLHADLPLDADGAKDAARRRALA
jgi:hypothetical protein